MWKAYQDEVSKRTRIMTCWKVSLPKANIEGGLSTIEEKALGNLKKLDAHRATLKYSSQRRCLKREGPLLYGYVVRCSRMRHAHGC